MVQSYVFCRLFPAFSRIKMTNCGALLTNRLDFLRIFAVWRYFCTMGLTVHTMDTAAFEEACRRLQQAVEASGYVPDTVLAIANGGVHVAANMYEQAHHCRTLLQRPGSRLKGRIFRALLRLLPRCVQDRLRIAEARLLHGRRRGKVPDFTLPDMEGAHAVLIVDDAVDSGNTLRAVYNAVRIHCPHAQIRSAVITVTTPDPAIMPDYALLNNSTLVRFPWAADS